MARSLPLAVDNVAVVTDTWNDDPWAESATPPPPAAPPPSPWAPLSRRAAGLGPEVTVYEAVPDHLRPALRSWVRDQWRANQAALEELQWRMRRRFDDDDSDFLDGEDLLDVIDGILRWWPHDQLDDTKGYWAKPNQAVPGPRTQLNDALTGGGSIWRVNADGDGVERRVDDAVTAATAATATAAGLEAGGHLGAAWTAAYGRHPDPDKAYAEAVKAVEAAACPVVLPSNGTATLGKVRDHLRDASAKWELVVPGKAGTPGPVTPVVALMTTLWDGQRSRHAGTPTSRRQLQEEAEAVVHLAAMLVQWLHSGVVRRKP